MAKQNSNSKNQFNDPRSKHNNPKQNQQRQQNFQNQQSNNSNASADYDNTNSGALFKNNRKNADGQPDLTGSINLDGVDYWLSAWPKLSKKNEKYLSLALTDKSNDDVKFNGKLETNEKVNDKHPDMVGVIKAKGEEINIAGWFHQNKTQGKYISLVVSEQSFDENISDMPWDF